SIRIRTGRSRVERFRTTSVCRPSHPEPPARPTARLAGSTASSAADAAPGSTRPAPWAVTGVAASGRAVSARRLRSAEASSAVRACASSAAAPATTAAAALEPLTVPYVGVPAVPVPGSEVVRATPGATSSGFTRPSKASPVEEKGATWPRPGFGAERTRPTATPTLAPLRSPTRIAPAVASGTSTTGIGALSSRPSEPLGRPPWTRTAAAPARAASSTALRGASPASTSAARPATRLSPPGSKKRASAAPCASGWSPTGRVRGAARSERNGVVGEGGIRLRERDECNARRVVRVVVAVRVDRALEAGDDLVAAGVHRPAAGRVLLPAGDADREHRRARRHAGEAVRAAAADEQAGHLRAVPLDLGLVVRLRRRERLGVPAHDVDPRR